ncbi:MAG: L,D-transpeptidase family protein [Actinomycetota bacterium]
MRRFVRLPRPPKWLLITGLALSLVLGGTAAVAYGYDQATTDHILPGVRIAGIDVSGMTRQQALRALDARAAFAMHRKLTIRAGGEQWTRTLGQLGMRVNPARAVDEAFDASGSLSWVSRVYHRLTHHSLDKLIPLPFTYNTGVVKAFIDGQVASAVAVEPQNAAIKLVEDRLVMQHSRTGETLKPLVAERLIISAMRSRKPTVYLPLLHVEPKVSDDSMGETLTVDLSSNTLRLFDGFDLERTYPVATARYGFTTPIGEWNVINKVEDPTWVNPCPGGGCWAAGEPATIGPGPGNPLGTRALYLDAPGIRIHGTPSDSSIGTYASHGCIRMHIYDSEALYPLVPIGAKVIIYGSPPWGNITFSGTTGA